MKRLLAYLFVVMGISILANISLIEKVEAKATEILKKLLEKKITKFCMTEGNTSWMKAFFYPLEEGKSCAGKILVNSDPNFQIILKKYAEKTTKYGDVMTLSQNKFNEIFGNLSEKDKKKIINNSVKANSKDLKGYCIENLPARKNSLGWRINPDLSKKVTIYATNKNKCSVNSIHSLFIDKKSNQKTFYWLFERYGKNNKKHILTFYNFKPIFNEIYRIYENKILIAKAEPSQTQEVAKRTFDDNMYLVIHFIGYGSKLKNAIGYSKDKKKAIKISKDICEKQKENNWDCYDYFYFYKGNYFYRNYESKELFEKNVSKYINPLHKIEFVKTLETLNTQIAKAEPTVAPKKKVKVAKVKEPKQEEFKPENKDNEAPVIEIAEAITVNDSTYEIEGKVIDKSKKLFVQIDGETIPVKKGKFKIKRFSPVDEQLKIVALDQWGNKSKPKLVNITIDLKETELAEKLEQLNPSLIKSKSNKNRVALIIGIEKYEQTPAANFANLDAQYFYEYARKGFGIPKSNIRLLVDEDADLIKSISSINKWLPSKIKKNKTELIIFFAGHGLASNNGQELYILPQDSDPDLLSRTALSRTELFEQIISLNPKSVTMFMDTCYSGISRDEKMLLASARPIRIVADDQEGIPDNFTIFTASKLDQISSGLEEAKHGIFSYYLMKGLEGKADENKDKKITNGELLAYMDENVSQKASELGRQQNPSLAGDPDKILMSYR